MIPYGRQDISQDDIDADPSLIDGTITDSFTGPARFLTMLAPLLEDTGKGTVIGVGSRNGFLRHREGGLTYRDDRLSGNASLFRLLDETFTLCF